MKLFLGLLLTIQFLFANESLKSIYHNILLKNTHEAILASVHMQNNIATSNEKEITKSFKKLVKSWKQVEAFYILGDLNDEYLDIPRYIDIFHQGNEDIKVQLDLILSGKEELKYALYKNSHKTINALEYMVYTKDLSKPRVQNTITIILAAIKNNLNEIYNGYIQEKETYLKNEVASNAMMLNALIETSYKLKEWRVGDPSGLSRKFKGKADNSRAEYYISKNSIHAIKAIITTHKMVLEKQTYKNFGTMIHGYGAKEELNTTIKYLNRAFENANKIDDDDFSEAKDLYKSLKKLHATYYITLIGKLKVTAKILDADGD